MRVFLRWSVALLVVIAAHAASIWIILTFANAGDAAGGPPPAVMIELAPIATSAEPPDVDAAPAPEVAEVQPEPEPEASEPPVEEPEPEPISEPEPPLDLNLPDLPSVPNAAAMLEISPRPPAQPIEKKEPPKKVERKPSRKPKPQERPRVRQATAPPSSEAPVSNRTAASNPGASTASNVASAGWASTVNGHIRKYVRAPAGARSGGVVVVAFSFDGSGRITSARVVRSSGQDVLDQQALRNIQSASPIPAPPPGMGASSLTVPINFNIR